MRGAVAVLVLVVACLGAACSDPPPQRPVVVTGAGQPAGAARRASTPPQSVLEPVGPSTSVHAGITFVEITTGGAHPSETLPLVIALHGLGDTPEAFLEVFSGLGIRVRVAAARALTPYYSGYAWLPPSPPGDIDDRAGPVRRAVAALEPAITELARVRPTQGVPVVMGFSQGAMVAYGLAASEHPVVSAAFPIAGYLPPSLATRRPANAPRIVAMHGTADPVVGLRDDRTGRAALERVGYTIELREYAGVRHTIAPAMLGDLAALLAELTRAPP